MSDFLNQSYIFSKIVSQLSFVNLLSFEVGAIHKTQKNQVKVAQKIII